MLLVGLKRCSTCRDIEKKLQSCRINYQYREIDKDIPSVYELKKWFKASHESNRKKLVNTSGIKYREMNLKSKWDKLSENEQYQLLATDGMLIKRPILITDNNEVYIGPKVKDYVNQKLEREDT